MDIRDLPLDDLVLDPNLNLRDRLDDFTVERYADSWSRMPPITVFEVDGRWVLADGFHRHAAAAMLGRKTIPAEVRPGTLADALDFVAGVNLFHGLPLTRAERRRAVEIKLKLHHDWSDRRMAEELAVSRDLVAKIRRQLIEGHVIPASAGRVGADGKTYPAALAKDPNERLPKGPALAQQDDPRDRGDREADPAPWDGPSGNADGKGLARRAGEAVPPWEDDPSAPAYDGPVDRMTALAPPPPSAAPTIDEMLAMMARQVQEVTTWTHGEGFVEAYGSASANARGLFQAATIKLAARADQLRKG